MAAYKDEKTGTYYVQFYYTDYTGTRKKKMKRGFKLQREAKEWEREFLAKQQTAPTLTLQALSDLYFEDMTARLRRSTIETKKWTVTHKVIPHFGKTPICAIKPADVRKWQAAMMEEGYSGTYLRMMNTQFSAIMNYAVKYYGLEVNPVRIAGTIGQGKADEMDFWTREEFLQFIQVINHPAAYAGYMILYYTGLRIGELLALTPADLDLEAGKLSVTKSLRMIGREAVITPPKTEKSTRTIDIPSYLCEALKNYMEKFYQLNDNDRLFPYSRQFFTKHLFAGCEASGVKRIRLHDLRHSHASLLIELGTPMLLISERLGHDNTQTTLNTYSHLFPSRREALSNVLEHLESK